ncbi:MAG TPA: response regulator [Chloroflexota bacterium]|jgi:CheY-like chemotaxis protein|nr:response regulator [Chloroflexota bacterium]
MIQPASGNVAARVLVVDDDPAIRDFVGQALEEEGYEVRLAINGQDALSTLLEWHADLIVLDLMMPTMDGWTFRARQREMETLANIPVIVMSAARNLDGQGDRLLPAAILPKPFDLDHLLTETERLLN